jgi:hypothetical protein
MSGLICAGNVHIGLLNDDGSFAGFLDIKNTTKFAIKPGGGEEKRRISKKRDSYGQVLNSVVIPGIPSIALEIDEGDAETVNMALLGTLSNVSLTSQTRTGVDFTVTARDTWLELGDRYINASGFAITNSDASATYVNGTDYVVDLTMGLIKVLSSGAISAADVVKKSYTTAAKTGKRVSGSKKNQLMARVLMNGKNLANGQGVVVEIPSCTLQSASEFDPMTGDYAVTSLSGTIVGDYTVEEIDA